MQFTAFAYFLKLIDQYICDFVQIFSFSLDSESLHERKVYLANNFKRLFLSGNR